MYQRWMDWKRISPEPKEVEYDDKDKKDSNTYDPEEIIADAVKEEELKKYVIDVAENYAATKVNEIKNEVKEKINNYISEIQSLQAQLEARNASFQELEKTYINELKAIKESHISGTIDKQTSEMITEFNNLRADDSKQIEDLKKKNLELEEMLQRKK